MFKEKDREMTRMNFCSQTQGQRFIEGKLGSVYDRITTLLFTLSFKLLLDV